jgi:hypothetical protein
MQQAFSDETFLGISHEKPEASFCDGATTILHSGQHELSWQYTDVFLVYGKSVSAV